jgi:hypothetical protein
MEEMAALFEAVKVIPLRPTDIVVFRTNKCLTQDVAESVRQALTTILPAGCKVLCLQDGDDIEVIRPDGEKIP